MASFLEPIARWTRSPAFKLGLIGFLILLLLIPLFIVGGLVSERERRARDVRSEVGRIWGPEQRLQGPFLVVPYTVRVEILQGDKRVEQILERRAVFTPEALDIVAASDTKTLRRSIFEVPVYASRMKLSGRFAAPQITDVTAEAASVRWRDASLVLGLTGVSGLKESAILNIPGTTGTPFAPSLGIPAINTAGIHAKLANAGIAVLPDPEKAPAAFNFDIDLTFNGSVSLDFAPAARETRVSLTSNWPHPSFAGAFLPDDRQVSAKGFKATWKIPHLARSVPESWSLHETTIERLAPYAFGVRMIAPVDFYSLINRATKYGLMFLTLAFMAVFCLELVSKKSVHSVQYLFTGIALVFFYVLLLSLAEHIGFTFAYLLAASATGIMLAGYIGAVLRDTRLGLIMLAVFAVTYLLLYVILQLEDYALLAGALLGFAALTIVMFATLRIDWSGRTAPGSASS
ncbi:MAG: cell envelope integrity protein CreD [Hyphomicrobiaceae bacterium]